MSEVNEKGELLVIDLPLREIGLSFHPIFVRQTRKLAGKQTRQKDNVLPDKKMIQNPFDVVVSSNKVRKIFQFAHRLFLILASGLSA